MRQLFVKFALAVALAATGVASSGCEVFGLMAYRMQNPKIKAIHKPDKVPTLIMVENRQNPGMLVAEADQLTAYITDDLNAYEVMPIVDKTRLHKLRDAVSEMDKLTISEIGRRVGAEQVLYVDLKRINVGQVEGIPTHGRVDAEVHLVDVKSGRTTFPKQGGSWPLGYETPITTDVSTKDPMMVRDTLLRATGNAIGRLFHDYNPEHG